MDGIAIVGLVQRPAKTEAAPPSCTFDPAPFGISPEEATRLRSDECVLLEACWEALEHAGLRPVDLMHYRPLVTCVWSGIRGGEGEAVPDDGTQVVGRCFPATPALSVEKYAECFSGVPEASQDEIFKACRRLERHECDVALVVGVGRVVSGYGTPGCAAVVLRRMPEAVGSGHTIHGVLKPSEPPTTWQALDYKHCPEDAATGVDAVIRMALANRSESAVPGSASSEQQVFVLSAATATALDMTTMRLADFLSMHPEANIADVAHTLQSGRAAFDYRHCFVASTGPEAITILTQKNAATLLSGKRGSGERAAAFLFPGLGDHYPGMGKELYDTQPEFRKWIDLCCEFLVDEIGIDLRPILFRAPEGTPHSADPFAALKRTSTNLVRESPLNETPIGHPSVFIVEYALARLLASWNIRPAILLGHSLGEYVAACLANVFSLEDALRVVAYRARMIGALPRGSMIAVQMSDTAVQSYLRPGAGVAAANSPYQTLLSGEREVLGQIADHLLRDGIACRWLETTHAFHSSMLSPVADGMRQLLKTVRINRPATPYISNLTGQLIRDEQVMSPEYWIRQSCERVNFVDGIGTLLTCHGGVIIEVGPGQSLCSFAKQHPLCDPERLTHIVPTMKSGWESVGEVQALLTAAGRLWLAGTEIDWSGLRRSERRKLVPVPAYPFEHRIGDFPSPVASRREQDLPTGAREASRDERRAKLRRARGCEESL